MARMTPEDIAALEPFWQPQAMTSKPTDPQAYPYFQYIGGNNSGVRVTPEIAFQVSTVWACIDVISSALASSDWNIFERLPKGDWDRLYDDPMNYLLNVRPNPEMTAKSFKQAVMIAASSWGNGYAEISRDKGGRVSGLWPIAPDRVDVLRDDDGIYYRIRNDDGSYVYLRPRDVFHIRGPGITGLLGDNVVAKAVRTIALTIAEERFSESYFGNNTQLGVVLEYPGKVDDPTYERLKSSWENRHMGPNKAFKVGIVEGGMKVHPMNIEADKAQMIEARKFQVEEICRWFRVPPHKVAHLDRSTFNNIEHLGLEFTRDTLRPWAREIQEEGQEKLFSARGKPRSLQIDLEWASQGDYKSRAEGHRILRNIGVLSANDILRAEGHNTIGKDGDVRIVNAATIKLEDVGINYLPEGGEKKPVTTKESGIDPAVDSSANAHLRTWLGEVFGRIDRRYKNRVEDAKKRGVSAVVATADAYEYAPEQLKGVMSALADAYGDEDSVTESLSEAVSRMLAKQLDPEKAVSYVFERLEIPKSLS